MISRILKNSGISACKSIPRRHCLISVNATVRAWRNHYLNRPNPTSIYPYASSFSNFTAITSREPSPKMKTSSEPTAEQLVNLLKALEEKFPTKTLGEDRWYLIAVNKSSLIFISSTLSTSSSTLATYFFLKKNKDILNPPTPQISALTGGNSAELVGHLYTHLISQPRYTTPSSRQQLVRRLREALVKSVSIVGVCKPIEAIFQIAEREREEDKDFSFSR